MKTITLSNSIARNNSISKNAYHYKSSYKLTTTHTDSFQGKTVKFGGGDHPLQIGGELFSYIKSIKDNHPSMTPILAMSTFGGGSLSAYGSYENEMALKDLRERVVRLQDAYLDEGFSMLQSSLEAAHKEKPDIATRDLGHSKSAFAHAAKSASTSIKRAIAHDYYATCCDLDGLTDEAKRGRIKAANELAGELSYRWKWYDRTQGNHYLSLPLYMLGVALTATFDNGKKVNELYTKPAARVFVLHDLLDKHCKKHRLTNNLLNRELPHGEHGESFYNNRGDFITADRLNLNYSKKILNFDETMDIT